MLLLPVKAPKLAGVRARSLSVPALASVLVANSTIPATVVVAGTSSPVFVPEFVPVI